MAQLLGRSVKSVVSKAHDLGLKKSEKRLETMGRENVELRYRPPRVRPVREVTMQVEAVVPQAVPAPAVDEVEAIERRAPDLTPDFSDVSDDAAARTRA